MPPRAEKRSAAPGRKYRERIIGPRIGTRKRSSGTDLLSDLTVAIGAFGLERICDGRTSRFGDRNCIAIIAAGTIKAIDPGTHMIAPAVA